MIPVHKMSSESHCWKKKDRHRQKLKHDKRTPRLSLRIRILVPFSHIYDHKWRRKWKRHYFRIAKVFPVSFPLSLLPYSHIRHMMPRPLGIWTKKRKQNWTKLLSHSCGIWCLVLIPLTFYLSFRKFWATLTCFASPAQFPSLIFWRHLAGLFAG